MKKTLYILVIVILLPASLSGCGKVFERIFTKPRPMNLGETPPGSPIFQKGWDDGCESGLSAYGGSRYKTAYGFQQDLSLVDNPEYYRAWKDAYTYCRWYVWVWDREWQQ